MDEAEPPPPQRPGRAVLPGLMDFRPSDFGPLSFRICLSQLVLVDGGLRRGPGVSDMESPLPTNQMASGSRGAPNDDETDSRPGPSEHAFPAKRRAKRKKVIRCQTATPYSLVGTTSRAATPRRSSGATQTAGLTRVRYFPFEIRLRATASTARLTWAEAWQASARLTRASLASVSGSACRALVERN
jgi:hypothetical protein